MAARRRQAKADDGYARETFTQPRVNSPELQQPRLSRKQHAATALGRMPHLFIFVVFTVRLVVLVTLPSHRTR
jgi:hypothetical protein